MKLILVLIDALRSDYLTYNNMPFLYDLSQKGTYIKKVNPSFGFCERSEIFSGMTPDISGNLFAIGYDPARSEFRKYKKMLSFLSRIKCMDKYIRALYYVFARKSFDMNIYNIPLDALCDFVLTEDGYNDYGRASETIFDILTENGMRYNLSRFTSLAHKNIDKDKTQIDGCEFIPIYIGDIDEAGHKYAYNIDLMHKYLGDIDNTLSSIFNYYNSMDNYAFIFLGDHGMEPINNEINVNMHIQNSGLVKKKDYDIFLDSTVCRIWCYNEIAKKRIVSILEEKLYDYGHIINEDEAIDRCININVLNSSGSKLYGDIIWCANVGLLIHPDYYNGIKSHDKGMHGYFDLGLYSSGLAVIYGNGIKESVIDQCKLVDLCPTMCDILNIRKTVGNFGESLISMKEVPID